ncbi:hypothetical protein J1N51_01925 [Psychrosphaera ytuae]|uniref:Uncharacterized protein n=1 Tax=Psychrosphaera ytuae TaxID=2820710 RepID=A0A975DBW3_9GAMM|nr:hypothetical protein [Psychrosphaera ytuae]QTH64266.1 hypothetical protein J1N51_01925 [Psychrosphaera ytuae]
MSNKITRERIEKYLIAHQVECSEQELMKLTRTLIDDTEEEAKCFLKQLILFYRDSGEFDIDHVYIEQHYEHLHSLPKITTHKQSLAQLILSYAFSIFILICCVAAIYKFIFS